MRARVTVHSGAAARAARTIASLKRFSICNRLKWFGASITISVSVMTLRAIPSNQDATVSLPMCS